MRLLWDAEKFYFGAFIRIVFLNVTWRFVQMNLQRVSRTNLFPVCCSGGILVFLTGQAEVHSLCRRLRKAFPFRKGSTTTGACTHTPVCPPHTHPHTHTLWHALWACFCIITRLCVQVKKRKQTALRRWGGLRRPSRRKLSYVWFEMLLKTRVLQFHCPWLMIVLSLSLFPE